MHPVGDYFPKKNNVLLSNFFSSSRLFFKRVHRARLREKEHLSRYRAQFEGNLLRFVRSRAHVRALMTQKSCAVGMRNEILRNYLKEARNSFHFPQTSFTNSFPNTVWFIVSV